MIVPLYNEAVVNQIQVPVTLVVNKAGHPVIDWFVEHYRPLPSNFSREYFVVFARRGGALEARMELAAANGQTQ